MKRVLKWNVAVDDRAYEIGSGKVVLVESQFGLSEMVQVWTEEETFPVTEHRWARVFGTGHDIPDDAKHLGSCILLQVSIIWHVYEV